MIVAVALLLLAQAGDEAVAQNVLDAPTVAEEPPEPDDDCDDPQDQQRMNFCASLDSGAADAALNEQWALTTAAMKAADAEVDSEYDRQPSHYETLVEGQRAWLEYRDAQCLAESFAMRGGSMQPLIEYSCKAYMTELRIQQLREMAAGPE